MFCCTITLVSELLRKFTPLVEKLGFDENFLDVTKMISVAPWCDMGEMPVDGFIYGSKQRGTPLQMLLCQIWSPTSKIKPLANKEQQV